MKYYITKHNSPDNKEFEYMLLGFKDTNGPKESIEITATQAVYLKNILDQWFGIDNGSN